MQLFLKLALITMETEAEKTLWPRPPVPAAAHEFPNLRLPIFAQIAAARVRLGLPSLGSVWHLVSLSEDVRSRTFDQKRQLHLPSTELAHVSPRPAFFE